MPEWFALTSQVAGWTVGASLFAASWRLSIVKWKVLGFFLGWAPAALMALMTGILVTAFWAAAVVIAIAIGGVAFGLTLVRLSRGFSLPKPVQVAAASARS